VRRKLPFDKIRVAFSSLMRKSVKANPRGLIIGERIERKRIKMDEGKEKEKALKLAEENIDNPLMEAAILAAAAVILFGDPALIEHFYALLSASNKLGLALGERAKSNTN